MLKYSKTPGIFKLEGNRLGRPYHRLPTLFTGNFDVIDSHLGSYFLKKHRSNITLKKIGCEMDIINKNAEMMVSQVGHLAFDIDRSLLLMLLGNFYGLESSLEEAKAHNGLPTKTETRLKNRLALDICTLIFNLQTSGIALKLKLDSSTVITHWAYQLTFTLAGDEESSFRILLDDAHTDFILNLIRHSEHSKPQQVAKSVNKPALIKEIIRSLPLTLNVKIAELSLNVADLTQIKAGDILPISLGETFPVAIGQSELFSALIVEDKDKLFLSELAGKNENSHE
ncbi:FliM/FliN family flagellar motor switch protein [Escherichia coli]|uniref:FliM/FliN family flagellar motor switch protein n=1 Tax=Escherichia coli TaxID=562 RepID=UPI0010815A19|nr:FliM/FliN family flagellar motor switch protein [Escherichia coli]EKY5861944.1 FliM/FliN family flagellar motor switch protein [Escherichia coli O157]EEW8432912.1 FliM/FliN family flagellar motor switch protein [Escherichia coli]EEY1460379.1 FliM/FliN family flagellar motor switch protein [Escherichia coli]EEY3224499.1 FliM/FliN family flagellar motor switch protein [Escherichia coli]EFA5306415.1 hypothetical protein [Escherichia coli]